MHKADTLREEGLSPSSTATPPSAGARASIQRSFSQPGLEVVLDGATVAGDGAPIVLSHALGLDLHMWDSLAHELAIAGHPVMRYDHRGHGASAVPIGPYSMADLVDDAARLVLEWGRGPIVWVGLSMGGMVGQGLAIEHPQLVQALVIANSTSRYPEAARTMWANRIATVEAKGLASIADAVIERYFAPHFRATQPQVTEIFRSQVLRTDPTGYAACCHAVAGVDFLDRLHKVRCPTLVIAGAQDVGAPVAMSEAIASRVPGAELAIFDDAAHLSVVEQPALFAKELRRFVGTLSMGDTFTPT